MVATARSGQEALREVARVKPQLVLLDSALGDREGPRLVQEMRQNFPDIKLIVMGLLPAHDDFVDFIKAGVRGFILKDATIEVFISTIMAVADGASVLPPLLARYAVLPRGRPGPGPRPAGREGRGADDQARNAR